MTFTRPTHQQLKTYLEQRREQGGPPPSPEEIRRHLGWELIKAEREQ